LRIANNFISKVGRGEAESCRGGTPAARNGREESVGGTTACTRTESRAFRDTGDRTAGSRKEGGRDEATSGTRGKGENRGGREVCLKKS